MSLMPVNPWWRLVLFLVLVLVCGAVVLLFPPDFIPDGEISRSFYREGELSLIERDFEVTDPSRPTAPNGSFAGSEQRVLEGRIWFPKEQQGAPYPLIVYSHGFMSRHAEAEKLAKFLVTHGYLVVAIDFPLTHYFAPGGPDLQDVVNQPGDLSFVIDQVLRRSRDPRDELFGKADPDRIIAAGLSLGGMTSTLLAYHPTIGDERIKATVSIAGPSAMFGRAFFESTRMPFLMIAADKDAIVPYAAHAAPVPDKVPGSVLVTLADGSHTGFAPIAGLLFRWTKNPDQLGCRALMNRVPEEGAENPFESLGDERMGIVAIAPEGPCQQNEFPLSMRPGRQQTLTILAVYGFLQSLFAPDADQRQASRDFLYDHYPVENPGVTIQGRHSQLHDGGFSR